MRGLTVCQQKIIDIEGTNKNHSKSVGCSYGKAEKCVIEIRRIPFVARAYDIISGA